MLNVLVVGGTGFLGGAVTDAALAAGHAVTVFTRGQTVNTPVSADIEMLIGDRHRDLSALQSRTFDLVVDTCAFTPDAVAGLLDALSPAIGRYALVSSVSAYRDFSVPGIMEGSHSNRATLEQLGSRSIDAPGATL
ncbi:NAD-dependent epimerase/dehydratase family protein (plasmid) [Phyllobacterium sp. A18/5-2]|uniref:NAD-dependent epimerase/dehydratase family protein n=1 Tax=Phyllobacterium sp. A18/5-2 TaxID=2978392 RepID=UPI0021C7A581|nr:NAD-dependent epimerase/dehydratase family protein [Phyllobacterium sp. A18/5-2]UXN67462.1 NAD-dependent epimerase/dehydratase family protein [Phyllobacterium sp. A18/5-2]